MLKVMLVACNTLGILFALGCVEDGFINVLEYMHAVHMKWSMGLG